MASLLDKIQADMKAAMKEKKALELSVLRMLSAAAKNKQIELKAEVLSDDQLIGVIKSEVKKRKDSAEQYKTGRRDDLADKELAEITILMKYLPEQLSGADIAKAVDEVIAELGEGANFGAIMGQTMAKLRGQADGNAVREAVNKKLQ